MGGLLLDGWAHSHGEVDQSFMTPWHALLYGSMGINGLVLLGAGIAGLRKGVSFRECVAADGYWGAATRRRDLRGWGRLRRLVAYPLRHRERDRAAG